MSTSTQKPRKRGSLFDPVVGQHHPKLKRNGATFVVLTAIFLFIIYTKPSIPFLSGGGTTLTADFKYAADVEPGRTPVDDNGVVVGVVTGEARNAAGNGIVLTMKLNGGQGVNLRSDATAVLRWRTLLGLNYYVDLDGGSPSAPAMGNNGNIPESRTSSQVELDQALEPLDASGRKAFGTLITAFNQGFANPAAVRGTINAAAPAMANLAAGLPALRGTDPGTDLPSLLANTNTWIQKLSTDDTNLSDLVNQGAGVVSVTAANQVDLGDIFNNAPDALEQTEATMIRLRGTLNTLNPVAEQLEPGAKDLAHAAILARTAVDAANPLLKTLRPTLNAIRPSVNALSDAARPGVEDVDNLTPILQRVNSTYIPWLNSVSPVTKVHEYESVGGVAASVSSILGYGDAYGTLAGFEAGVGEQVIQGQDPCTTELTNPNYPLTDKITCQALVDTITSIFTGTPVSATAEDKMQGDNLPASLVQSFLKSPNVAAKLAADLKGKL